MDPDPKTKWNVQRDVGRRMVKLGFVVLATAVVIGGLAAAAFYALEGRPGTWLAKAIGYVYVGAALLIAMCVIPAGLRMSRRAGQRLRELEGVPAARVVNR